MQGALYGARSLAMGMGPVLFAALFSVFSRSDSNLPYFPGKALRVIPFTAAFAAYLVSQRTPWVPILVG